MKNREIAALLLVCAAQGALADAQSSVTINQVSMTVKDLTPSDGIAAAASWGSSWSISTNFSPSTQTSWSSSVNGGGVTDFTAGWSGDPVLASSFNGGGPAYGVSVLGGLGQASVQIAPDGTLSELSLSTTAQSGQRLSGNVYLGQWLMIQPGTEVTVSMTLSGRVSVDAAVQLPPPATGGYSYPPHGYARISADQYATGSGASFSTYVSNYMFAGLTGAHANEPSGVVLVATIANPNADAYYFSMGVLLNTEATQINTAIPEPTTWALMALGLLGVGTAARRRKA